MEKILIQQVININEKYSEIRKIKGEDFNIFSILDMERREVRTHSNFLFELLNHEGSHYQDRVFLKLFLEKVLALTDYGDIDKVFAIQEYKTFNNRRIDFVIKTEKYHIGIEMKVDAEDQDKQLKDYMTELQREKGKVAKLFYLTLTGNEASIESTGNTKLAYLPLSFEYDIYQWILSCIEKSATNAILREGLVHYKNLIAKITNKIAEPMEREMEELIKTPTEIEAVQKIVNEYPRIWAKKKMEFLDRLKESIKAKYTEFSFEFSDVYNIWNDEGEEQYDNIIVNLLNSKYTGFTLFRKYNNKYQVELHIEEVEGILYLSISFCNLNDDTYQKMSSELKKICKEAGFKRTNDVYQIMDTSNQAIFYHISQKNPSYDLFDSEKFGKYVSSFSHEIGVILTYLMNHEKEIIRILS